MIRIPQIKAGKELVDALTILPLYDDSIRSADMGTRLIALSNIYQIYIPSQMSIEIYNKLYLALLRSLQKKESRLALQQRYENYKVANKQAFNGILGGSDSFTIIGTSGIGKSSSISRTVSLLTETPVIEASKPYIKVIPCLTVQCPFDSSVKSFLLDVARKMDDAFDTNYYQRLDIYRRATTDSLIGAISTMAINHIGVLIVDEIQNVVNSKNGQKLIGALTQLINSSGISICMVGTPESTIFFEQAMHLARRSVGLEYTGLPYDNYFVSLCKVLFRYQYTQQATSLNDGIIDWLYQHSNGIISIVVSLIHDAQEIAILTGKEELNLETLNAAYTQRLSMLHGHIAPDVVRYDKPKNKEPFKSTEPKKTSTVRTCSIKEVVNLAKKQQIDVVSLLKKNFIVEEVKI